MTYIYAILAFSLIIFVHELGHFLVAKASGITVLRFSIGFGPAIISKNIGGTTYAIRAIPLGGSVMMLGEDELEDDFPEAIAARERGGCKTYRDVSPIKRILVCFMGSFSNFVTGILILLIIMGSANWIVTPTITEFMDGFEYEGEQGFMVGDTIKSVEGYHVFTYNDLLTGLSLITEDTCDIVLERNGETIKLKDFSLAKNCFTEEEPGVHKFGFIFGYEEAGPWDKVEYALKSSLSFLQNAYKSIGMLFTGKVSTDNMMGTVGIATEISERAKVSFTEMWYFLAFISINLAFVNLLPLPVLDGGKIVFVLIEMVRGKPLDPKYESWINAAGIVLVLGLFVYLTYNDIVRLIAK